MLFSSEGVLHISIDCDDALWSGHFKFQISIVQDRIETGESGSSKQCVIDIVERVELLFEKYESAEIKTMVFSQTWKELLQYDNKADFF